MILGSPVTQEIIKLWGWIFASAQICMKARKWHFNKMENCLFKWLCFKIYGAAISEELYEVCGVYFVILKVWLEARNWFSS